MLRAPAAGAPKAGDAFLVVDATLAIQGLSRTAEALLSTFEEDAVNRRITDFLADAARMDGAADKLERAIAISTRGDCAVRRVDVRGRGGTGSGFAGARVPRAAHAAGATSGATGTAAAAGATVTTLALRARIGPCGPPPAALVIVTARARQTAR
jgi:hypothetical protein